MNIFWTPFSNTGAIEYQPIAASVLSNVVENILLVRSLLTRRSLGSTVHDSPASQGRMTAELGKTSWWYPPADKL